MIVLLCKIFRRQQPIWRRELRKVCCEGIMGIAVMALIGHALKMKSLSTILGDGPPMAITTASSFILTGFVFLLDERYFAKGKNEVGGS